MGKKIRFLHTGDTHNGYSGNASSHNEFEELKVNKTTETGLNIRTDDVNKAFAQVIDIAIEEDVDFVTHSGDGMNHWGYKYPAHFNFYMKHVKRFTDLGKQWFEIAGNHNFAKKSDVGSDLFKLSLLPNVTTVYKGFYERYEIPGTNVVCHGLPSSFDKDVFQSELNKIEKVDGKINILVAHCGVSTIPQYTNNDSSIVVHLDDLVNLQMDYVALGDFHRFTDLGNNIIYPGPIEHLAYGQEENPRVLIVEIDTETKEVTIKHRFLNVRPMIDMKPIDAKNKELKNIQEQILARFKECDVDEAIVRLRIENLSKSLKHRHLFLTDEIREQIDRCLYFKFEFKNKIELSESIRLKEDIPFESLHDGLTSFINQMPVDPNYSKDELQSYAAKYLSEVLENDFE
ncbi:metallophosphoesterase family protein [Bacillus toyonensis]|uniref:metallophosphoesterase family protein n=1 Tax=Bacillus toyonensis TaxID=155322 RepID=UPI002E1CCED0|nr:metallophosphoesterase [Bacillus toyonensis]MED2737428.1 metallophosphoesterase [Bacillus toyonensis]